MCDSESQNIINENNFWQKRFCKIINATRSFHKKNIFLIRVGEMIFFEWQKIHDFCSRIDNSNSL